MNHKNIFLNLFLGIMLPGSLFASNNQPQFEEGCKQNEIQQLMLFVNTDNENGIRAYGKSGFEINLAYNDNVDSYTMVKKLD